MLVTVINVSKILCYNIHYHMTYLFSYIFMLIYLSSAYFLLVFEKIIIRERNTLRFT